jgi:hypothetical protein
VRWFLSTETHFTFDTAFAVTTIVVAETNVSPVKYELGFISQKTTFFIVTAVETSNLT